MIHLTSSTTFESLAASLEGDVVLPGSAAYDERRKIWNDMIDRKPAAFVVAKSTADVVAAVNFARETGTRVSVCGGGHNVAGNALIDDGLVIDLREFRDVEVDAARKIVRTDGGATLGDINDATGPHNLILPVGVVSDTGVAGLTLGGGMGWAHRKYGTTSDNLLRAEVVLASGEVVQASEDENPDLFWALRGGGNSPGVVTQFEFRAYDIGDNLGLTLVILPIDQAADGLRMYREFARTAPDDLSMIAVLGPVPPLPEIDEQYHHTDALILAGAWVGDPEEELRATAPLREFGKPIADLSERVPREVIQGFFDEDYPKGHRYYWKSRYIDGLPDAAIEWLVELAKVRPSVESTIDVWLLGGATARVDPSATAYAHRSAPFLIGIEANWGDSSADDWNIGWAREVFAGTEPYAKDGGLYVNFPGFGEEQEQLVRKALGSNYDRMQAVLSKYDPDRVFAAKAHIRLAEQAER